MKKVSFVLSLLLEVTLITFVLTECKTVNRSDYKKHRFSRESNKASVENCRYPFLINVWYIFIIYNLLALKTLLLEPHTQLRRVFWYFDYFTLTTALCTSATYCINSNIWIKINILGKIDLLIWEEVAIFIVSLIKLWYFN